MIPFLRFTDEAQEVFDAWRGELERNLRSDREPAFFCSHLAKYRSLVPSIALLIHLAEDRRGAVGVDALNQAIGWARYLEKHARRIYASALRDGGVPAARALARHILDGDLTDGFTLRIVYRRHWAGLASPDDAKEAIVLLLELDWLREVHEDTRGKPRVTYLINPRIQERATK